MTDATNPSDTLLFNGLTEAETLASASIRGLSPAAPEVPAARQESAEAAFDAWFDDRDRSEYPVRFHSFQAGWEASRLAAAQAAPVAAEAPKAVGGELYLGLCLDEDRTLHATIMRKEADGSATVLLSDYVKMPQGQDVIMRAGSLTASTSTAAPAGAEYPLPDSLYPGSKDWLAGNYSARVEWLHTMYEARKADVERMEGSTAAPAGEVAVGPQWISVEKALPELNEQVLIASWAWGDPSRGERIYGYATYLDGADAAKCWVNDQDPDADSFWYAPTHWMRIPAVPGLRLKEAE